jgi:hypothetical protein
LGTSRNSNGARIFLALIFFPKKEHEKKKHTRGATRPKQAQVVWDPAQAAPSCLVFSPRLRCRPSSSQIDGFDLKTPIKRLLEAFLRGGDKETRNHKTKDEPAKIGYPWINGILPNIGSSYHKLAFSSGLTFEKSTCSHFKLYDLA